MLPDWGEARIPVSFGHGELCSHPQPPLVHRYNRTPQDPVALYEEESDPHQNKMMVFLLVWHPQKETRTNMMVFLLVSTLPPNKGPFPGDSQTHLPFCEEIQQGTSPASCGWALVPTLEAESPINPLTGGLFLVFLEENPPKSLVAVDPPAIVF